MAFHQVDMAVREREMERDPRELPGFKKKSFSLPYRNGEIWFEHLDGLYGYEELALEKLRGDRVAFSRPSASARIGLVLTETTVTPRLADEIAGAVLHGGKEFCRVCVIGADRKAQRALRARLHAGRFALAFFRVFEAAKEWLIPENRT